MSRKRKAVVRDITPDYKFNSVRLSKFINCLMLKGKKSLAEKIVYGAFDIIKDKTEKDPMEVFEGALKNATPQVKVVSKRLGGSNYQVPREIEAKEGQAMVFRWIIGFARTRKEDTMSKRLAEELIAANKGEGASVKKKDETHKMAEANRAFAHIRW